MLLEDSSRPKGSYQHGCPSTVQWLEFTIPLPYWRFAFLGKNLVGSAWPLHSQERETRDVVCGGGVGASHWPMAALLIFVSLPQRLCTWEVQNIVCSVNRGWICFCHSGTWTSVTGSALLGLSDAHHCLCDGAAPTATFALLAFLLLGSAGLWTVSSCLRI